MQEASMRDLEPLDSAAQLDADFWESLTFSFTMDQGPNNNQGEGSSRGNSTQKRSQPRRRAATTASQLPAQMTTHSNQSMPSLPPLAQAFGPPVPGPGQPVNPQEAYEQFTRALRTLEATYPHLQGTGQMHQMQMQMPPPSLDPLFALSWLQGSPATGQWGNTAAGYHSQSPVVPAPHIFGQQPTFPRETPGGSTSDRRPSPTPSTERADSPQDTRDLTEAERQALADDKRRRNTAASARFRIKKKQKVLNLERSVSDLTGRAEDLEREAAELRRENGWLKEIIVLKSKTVGGAMPDLSPSDPEEKTVGPSTQEENDSDKSEGQNPSRSKKGKRKA
ncbi:hypothetical protein OE88DRAFT_150894 [Heliocybe sulcata]|uniref:BZIP domain-containing protein n=1 Tax=Heliocybe sulcata TaxID=5364 RepID=A0A5C3NK26_9AGAM|nr:hypothetical protein OE88DRAFT_150894 [Heliocybe sulcata]